MKLRDLIAVLDDWFPAATAADWDAVGLVWGDPASPVHRVLFAVDPSPAVAHEAAGWGADLLVVHHPLFLRPVHGVPRTDPKGRVIGTLADAGCALYTAHTNADQASGGVSESLAVTLGLTDLEPITPGIPDSTGIGRIGRVPDTTLGGFAALVSARLPPTPAGLRVAGAADRVVRRVAVCGGSGDFLLDQLAPSGVDVYVTSDLRHHRAAEFLEHGGPALIDVSHWAAEWTWLPDVADRLAKATGAGMRDSVETRVSLTPTDPLEFPDLKEQTLKADPFAQLKLLDLQLVDAQAQQARHQRSHLPEHAELTALARARLELDNRVRDARVVVDDLTADQLKADQDVEQVRARRVRDQQRIDQGLITNPKDLEHMQHELVSLDRRIGVLEDEELEVMERLEEAQGVLDSLVAQLAAVDERGRALVASRHSQIVEIDGALGQWEAERSLLAAELPGDLLSLYERLRDAKDGVGAAELRLRQCAGCRLTLDNLELAKIKATPSDEVIRCEECQRILVRTAESGL